VENLSITILYGYESIDNSLMEAMALAWPYLRKIYLRPHNRRHSSINLRSFLYLAQYCPALKSVTLEFDVSLPINLMDPGEKPSAGICNESMTRLSVHRSRITDPPAVATFLSDVFPSLRLHHDWHLREELNWDSSSIPSEDDDDPDFIEMCKRWKEVDNLLAMGTTNRMKKD
jgi:hypothetical protein